MRRLKEFVPAVVIVVGLAVGIFFTDITQPMALPTVVAFLLIATGLVTRFVFGWGWKR